jgi:hypothetical protein
MQPTLKKVLGFLHYAYTKTSVGNLLIKIALKIWKNIFFETPL